ncbi:uncharacterized protein LOC108890106 isoform X8 [Scomber scombrus]|uniref:Uncharacterized protein LOC108890106 isoform X8 n=1 Tax=Scomber scombrus TaxID=13677 RepID=A0AAV1PMF7_SCOSC
MMSFAMITALLLYSLSWISVSASEFHTVEVRLGEEVTLLCSNFSSSPSQIVWFKLLNRTNAHCISFLYNYIEPASFCHGIQHGKFELTSDIQTLFLKIKHVDLSDDGLYVCGYWLSTNPVIVSTTYLEVQGEPGETTNLISVILTSLTLVLTKVIIGLIIKMTQTFRQNLYSDEN